MSPTMFSEGRIATTPEIKPAIWFGGKSKNMFLSSADKVDWEAWTGPSRLHGQQRVAALGGHLRR